MTYFTKEQANELYAEMSSEWRRNPTDAIFYYHLAARKLAICSLQEFVAEINRWKAQGEGKFRCIPYNNKTKKIGGKTWYALVVQVYTRKGELDSESMTMDAFAMMATGEMVDGFTYYFTSEYERDMMCALFWDDKVEVKNMWWDLKDENKETIGLLADIFEKVLYPIAEEDGISVSEEILTGMYRSLNMRFAKSGKGKDFLVPAECADAFQAITTETSAELRRQIAKFRTSPPKKPFNLLSLLKPCQDVWMTEYRYHQPVIMRNLVQFKVRVEKEEKEKAEKKAREEKERQAEQKRLQAEVDAKRKAEAEAKKKAEEEKKQQNLTEGQLKDILSKIPARPSKTIRNGAGCIIDQSKKVAEWDAKYAQYKKYMKK